MYYGHTYIHTIVYSNYCSGRRTGLDCAVMSDIMKTFTYTRIARTGTLLRNSEDACFVIVLKGKWYPVT